MIDVQKALWTARVGRSIGHFLVSRDTVGSVKRIIADVMRGENGRRLLKAMQEQPRGAELFARRARLPARPREHYGQYPEGSLGHTFFEHLVSADLDPSLTLLPDAPPGDDIGWALNLSHDMHDPLHAITGFYTHMTDEAGLQAFWLAQFPARGSAAVLTAALAQVVLRDWHLKDAFFDAVTRGWIADREAAPIMSYDFEAWWAEPVTEIRRRVGLPEQGLGTPER